MATFSRQKLSGSTNGKSIKIAATATAGTTVHTATSSTRGWDEIYVWLTNTSSSPVDVTVEFGGVTNPDNLIVKDYTLPANSPPIPVLTGQMLQNSLVVGIFASSANVVLATGFVNRIQ